MVGHGRTRGASSPAPSMTIDRVPIKRRVWMRVDPCEWMGITLNQREVINPFCQIFVWGFCGEGFNRFSRRKTLFSKAILFNTGGEIVSTFTSSIQSPIDYHSCPGVHSRSFWRQIRLMWLHSSQRFIYDALLLWLAIS